MQAQTLYRISCVHLRAISQGLRKAVSYSTLEPVDLKVDSAWFLTLHFRKHILPNALLGQSHRDARDSPGCLRRFASSIVVLCREQQLRRYEG